MQKKILYLDDEIDQIYTLKILLSDFKEYDFHGTTSVEEFFTLLNTLPLPDIIFIDIMMTEMSGWEVFDKIKDNPTYSHIPVIFLTARTDEVAKNAGTQLGDGYIEKPFEKDQILKQLESIFKKEQLIQVESDN